MCVLSRAGLCSPVCGDSLRQPQDPDTPSTDGTGRSEAGELPTCGAMAAVSEGTLVGMLSGG